MTCTNCGFGFLTLTGWCEDTSEALDLLQRARNAGANTAADHIVVTDRALAQIPDAHRHGTPILICADGAGATKGWLAHLRHLRDEQGLDLRASARTPQPIPGPWELAICHSRSAGTAGAGAA